MDIFIEGAGVRCYAKGMKKLFCIAGLSMFFALFVVYGAFAAPQARQYQGKTYYTVTSTDSSEDTGNEVCAKAGKPCMGYTGFTNDICTQAHPTASVTTTVNGSKAGFYCDGAPQTGLACEKAKNNCQVCPACNVNAECSTEIGGLFREMYVQCGADTVSATYAGDVVKTSLKQRVINLFSGWAQRIFSIFRIQRVTQVQVKVPGGQFDQRIGMHPGKVICEFYQETKAGDTAKSNKKFVTCGAVNAADTFCMTTLGSRFAKAEKCEDNGIVVCSNPCNPPQAQQKIQRCAYDESRPRGNPAAPIEFCDVSVTETQVKGTKKLGEVCQHGGECTTGNGIGIGPDYGKVYQCSCDPFKLDFSCNTK